MERWVGQTLDRYKITRLLGEGEVGAVFRATDLTLQRDVAVKIVYPDLARRSDFRDRFLQEARAAAQLDHPSIVHVYDFGEAQSLLYIVMEFIEGANLRELLEQLKAGSKWLPLDESVEIVRYIALALDYAHRQGVLRRDLRPSTMMIEPEATETLSYRPILTDLGLSSLVTDERREEAGPSPETLAYMSPEQALGQDTDVRSSVYSLGVLLYELAVGQPPFTVETRAEALQYHVQEQPPPPSELRPDLPPRLEHMILKALEKDPNDRWQNAAALAQALRALWEETSGIVSVPPAIGTTVSLIDQYQETKDRPQDAPATQSAAMPAESGDLIQARLPDGTTVEVNVPDTGMTVGRTADNDLVLNTSNVSRHHARIELDGQTYRVIDLDSTNGTYIGNTKLSPGIPEVWTTNQTLRIGDVWLRLVQAPGSAPTQKLSVPTAAATPSASSRLVRSSVGEGRVGVVMTELQLSVRPGDRIATSITLINQGARADYFAVEVEGIPADWVDLPPAVQLMPGERQEVAISLHPPRISESRAGRYAFIVRVMSRDAPTEYVDVRATLTVGTFSQFRSALRPQNVAQGTPVRVTVRNEGNYPAVYTISALDPGNELLFEPSTSRLEVPEGEAAVVELLAKPRRRALIGNERSHPFAVEVVPATGDTQELTGKFTSQPLIPAWTLPVVFTLLLIACAFIIYFSTRPPVIELAEVVPPNPVAGEPVTVRWRVRNAESIELRPFGIEVNTNVGEYTFESGFSDPVNLTLVASNDLRSTRRSLNIAVGAPAVERPIINEWSVFPAEITAGQEVTIRWNVSNAESVILQPFGTVESSGERTDTPQQSETYTLIATNPGGTVEQSQRVLVGTPAPNAPEITAFTVVPTTVVEGQAATIQISWETLGANTVTIEPGLGPVGLAGSRDVPAPNNDTTYTLVATGPGGEAQAQAQVDVQPRRCLVSGETALRSGPGTIYDPPLITLPSGAELRPVAYSPAGDPEGEWVRVQVVSTGDEGWVNRSALSECNVDVSQLGTAPSPPTPTPPPPAFAVTEVLVTVDPASHTGACPQEFVFTGEITVNGAGAVTYRWERSDNAVSAESTLNFDGPGAATVSTNWQLGDEGTHWQRLHVLSPNDILSNQATITLECVTETSGAIAYVYDTDQVTAQSFGQLLAENEFTVTPVRMNDVLTIPFSDYDLVLIGSDTGSGFTWGDSGNQANTIRDAGVPIMGLGRGGAAFFEQLALDIGWGDGWVASGASVSVVNPSQPIWMSPNVISVPGSGNLQIYTEDRSYVAIHLLNPIAGVTPLGQQPDDDTHHIIIRQNAYTLWGWEGGPEVMTTVGREVFINTMYQALNSNLAFALPISIQF